MKLLAVFRRLAQPRSIAGPYDAATPLPPAPAPSSLSVDHISEENEIQTTNAE